MKLLRWLTERDYSQADANAALRKVMAEQTDDLPNCKPRYRPEWTTADHKVRA